jgi:hypothetical protein
MGRVRCIISRINRSKSRAGSIDYLDNRFRFCLFDSAGICDRLSNLVCAQHSVPDGWDCVRFSGLVPSFCSFPFPSRFSPAAGNADRWAAIYEMGQHYLPQHYLKGFASGLDSSTIWVFDKENYRRFQSSVVKVANENKYWSHEMESWMAQDIESPSNRVLDKIRNRQPLSANDKATLSIYIVTLLRRVPLGKKRAAAWLTDKRNTDPIFDEMQAILQRQINDQPEASEQIRKALIDLEHAKNSPPDASQTQTIWEKSLDPRLTAASIHALRTMSWAFLTHDKEPAFLTGDNPVFYFHDKGVGPNGAELSFPVDMHTVLWAVRSSNWREEYFEATKDLIAEMNRRTVFVADRYVYSDQVRDWTIRLVMRKKLPLIKDLPRKRK